MKQLQHSLAAIAILFAASALGRAEEPSHAALKDHSALKDVVAGYSLAVNQGDFDRLQQLLIDPSDEAVEVFWQPTLALRAQTILLAREISSKFGSDDIQQTYLVFGMFPPQFKSLADARRFVDDRAEIYLTRRRDKAFVVLPCTMTGLEESIRLVQQESGSWKMHPPGSGEFEETELRQLAELVALLLEEVGEVAEKVRETNDKQEFLDWLESRRAKKNEVPEQNRAPVPTGVPEASPDSESAPVRILGDKSD